MAKLNATGRPINRPLWWDFPQEADCWEIDDQYMFGDDYLAAPILAAGVRSRTVYLPGAAAVATAADGTGGSTKSAGGPAGGSAAAAAGVTWRHVFTNATYLGGKNYTIAAPLDSFPLFERVEARARQRAEDAE